MMGAVEDARAAVEAFFVAFNARNTPGQRDVMHFPHVRLASSRVIVTETAEQFAVPYERLEEVEGWHHSTLDACELVHDGPDKVHFDVRFRRYHADGECYAEHRSLWVITRDEQGWGVQARSSYAP